MLANSAWGAARVQVPLGWTVGFSRLFVLQTMGICCWRSLRLLWRSNQVWSTRNDKFRDGSQKGAGLQGFFINIHFGQPLPWGGFGPFFCTGLDVLDPDNMFPHYIMYIYIYINWLYVFMRCFSGDSSKWLKFHYYLVIFEVPCWNLESYKKWVACDSPNNNDIPKHRGFRRRAQWGMTHLFTKL